MTAPVQICRTTDRRRRSGIALVIVLGLMAMLMILAVGFFVAMRTERLVARSYADQVRAREMAYLAIHRAIADIDSEISASNRVVPNWPTELKVSQGGIAISRPFFDLAANPADSTNDYAFMSFPAFLRPSLVATTNPAAGPQWLNVNPTFTGTPLSGRYAYLAANVSGFLDPNMDYTTNNIVSNHFTRSKAYDARDIGYNISGVDTFLTELSGLKGSNLFLSRNIKVSTNAPYARNRRFYRAETVPDLWILGEYGYSSGMPLKSYPAGYPTSLFPYSYFPLGFSSNGVAQTSIYIGGTAAEVEALKPQVSAAFAAMPGVKPDSDPDALARGLVDYLDSDFVPGGVDGGGTTTGPNCDMVCNEAVPMLHQFHINTNISPSSSVYRAGVQIVTQVWYPFAWPTNSLPYSIKMEVSVDGNGYAADGPSSATVALPTPVNGWIAHSYVQCTNTFWFQTSSTNAIPTSLTLKELSVIQGAKVVDRACGAGSPSTMVIPWGTYFTDTIGTSSGSWWWAPEPRINWIFDPAGNSQWRAGLKKGAGSPPWAGGNPGVPGEYPNPVTGVGIKEMYVRNRDQLRNAGELGLLAYEGAARAAGEWKTIRLIGADALPVLDVFTVHTNALAGILNPNTINTNVLAAVFLDALADRWPGDATNKVNAAIAGEIAKRIVVGHGAMATPFNNRSDFSRINFAGIPASFGGAGGALDEAQAEGVLRNTQALLSPRQNLFLIVVNGQAVTDANANNSVEENAGEVRGEARAVALVWRDPYKVNGRNKIFIRWIKWLDE